MKRVTIIGMGPRGLSVLERLTAAAVARQLALEIHLIEPGECGQGVHAAHQPQYLLINTLASQVTMFPAPGAVDYPPPCATPSLTEWARQRGYRRIGELYRRAPAAATAAAATTAATTAAATTAAAATATAATTATTTTATTARALSTDTAGDEIADSDYLPRALLGEYLSWVYQQLKAALPPSVTLTHHRQRATDLQPQPDGSHQLTLETGDTLHTDYLFLTTGHGVNEPDGTDITLADFAAQHASRNHNLAYVRHAYPTTKLAGISPAARVAIQGLGLSAHDVIAELTAGRGGAFSAGENGALRYHPSGHEPRLTLFSRECMPHAARGVNQKGLDGRHQPRHFTPDAIAVLRRQSLIARGNSQLDFERDLLPLLRREMAAAHPAAPPLEELLFPLWNREFNSQHAFRRHFRQWLQADLAEARKGNLDSPAKAATDVLRDVRATLQAAIEHGGLTPASHRQFLSRWHPAINRACFGPPLRRNQELLALLDAGVIDLQAGPGCRLERDAANACYVLRTGQHQAAIDVVIIARLDPFSPKTDTSLLIRNVLQRGLIRPYHNGDYHPGGIDIDQAGQPLGAEGRPLANVWALGYPTEGAHYYTHALPRPGLRSRQVWDAEHCLAAMLAKMGLNRQPEFHTSTEKLGTLYTN